MAADKSSRKVHALMKKRWDHMREYWRPQNDMYGRLLAFCLDLEHYKANEGFSKDRRRIQPRTQKQLNLIRHKASLLLRKLPQFDGHAVQPSASGRAAEITRRIVENTFLDPLKDYSDVRGRFIWSVLAGGRGNYAVDWHPRHGILFRFVDPRRVHITPGHTSMHSPLTPNVTEEVPMRMSEVLAMRRAGWNVPGDLNPDDWKPDYATGNMRDDNLVDFSSGASPTLPGADESEESDKIVTVLKNWYREDPYQNAVRAQSRADLPEDEWHFADDSTGERIPFDPMSPEPPTSQATGAPMRLVTSRVEMNDPGEGEAGYLCITAPFYQGGKPLFEGSWTEGALNPSATLSVFPYAEMTCYTHPLRRQGLSDTEATRTLVVVDNSSYRSVYEQMRQSGAIIATEPGALKDSEGNQFQISDDAVSLAYGERLSLESLKFHQLPGMNPAAPAFRSMVNESWQSIGTGDFSSSLGPERSKDIAASTLSQLTETGDLPVQLHAAALAHQEGLMARAVVDLCRAYMGDNVVSWVTGNKEAAYATVRGSDLVPLHVSVSADKEWRQQDNDRLQAQSQFIGMVSKLGLPLQAMIVLLKEAQLSEEVVDALMEAMVPPGPTGPPSPGGPPNLQVIQGGNPNE